MKVHLSYMVLELLLQWLVVIKAFCGGMPFFLKSAKRINWVQKKREENKAAKENEKN